MTTMVTVSVNGNYKIAVKQGANTTIVSGRGHEGPNSVNFHPAHGDGAVFIIGPEEPDNGEEAEHAELPRGHHAALGMVALDDSGGGGHEKPPAVDGGDS